MLKIKDNVDLKELEKYGFKKDKYCPSRIIGEYDYAYQFLRINTDDRTIMISSGYDDVNSYDEVSKLYDLIQAGLVEKAGNKDE
jgi:hypothetical protein